MSQSRFIDTLGILVSNSDITLRDSELVIKLKPSLAPQLLLSIEKMLAEDFHDEEANFFLHPFTFQRSENIASVEIGIDRTRVREKLKILVYFDPDHFLSHNRDAIQEDVQICLVNEGSPHFWRYSDADVFSTSYRTFVQFKNLLAEVASEVKNETEFQFSIEQHNSFQMHIERGYLIEETELANKIFGFIDAYDLNSKYREEFKLILKKVIADIVRRNHDNDFGILAKRFREFSSELIKSYHVFLAQFSFEEVKNTFLEERQKYTELLDKNLDNSFKIILSIPLGVGLTLMLKLLGNNPIFENLVVFVAFTLFLTFSLLVLRHNSYSLQINETMVHHQEEMLKDKIGVGNGNIYESDFRDAFTVFKKKIKLTRSISFFTVGFLAILFTLFLTKLLTAIPDIRAWIKAGLFPLRSNLTLDGIITFLGQVFS